MWNDHLLFKTIHSLCDGADGLQRLGLRICGLLRYTGLLMGGGRWLWGGCSIVPKLRPA